MYRACIGVAASLAIASGTATTGHEPTSGEFVKVGTYPGYTGDLNVTGFVKLRSAGDNAVGVGWTLQGLEKTACAGAPPVGVANACGVHIHVGKTCTDAEKVGGHHYNETAMKKDPWSPISYKTHNPGSKGHATVNIGEPFDSIEGRAYVVHDSTGARVGCGLISAWQLQKVLSMSTVIV